MKQKMTIMALCPAVCLLCSTAQAAVVIQAASFGPVDSGISITPGTYQITASGMWSWATFLGVLVTATGEPGNPNNDNYDEYFGGANKGGLVAYVGNSPPPNALAPAGTPNYYAILNGAQTVTFTQKGELYFVINDDPVSWGWGDNAGSLNVNVTPVPEPTTMISGALALLLPLVASTRRILRKK